MEKQLMAERILTIAEYYGVEAQLLKLCEECGELTTAAAKQLGTDNEIMRKARLDNLVSELADVEVISAQVKYLLGIEDRVARVADYKINRQLRRMAQDMEFEKREGQSK